jgi:hypothetical protein
MGVAVVLRGSFTVTRCGPMRYLGGSPVASLQDRIADVNARQLFNVLRNGFPLKHNMRVGQR